MASKHLKVLAAVLAAIVLVGGIFAVSTVVRQVTPTKDPSQGVQVAKNDTPDAGPDTNNGVGAQYSSVQEPDGSIFLDSYEEYEEKIDELEEAINTNPARPAGSSNDATYQPDPPADYVDSNAENGTGYGGMDDPTPVAPFGIPGHNPNTPKVAIDEPEL